MEEKKVRLQFKFRLWLLVMTGTKQPVTDGSGKEAKQAPTYCEQILQKAAVENF